MALSTDRPSVDSGGPSPARHRRRWPWIAAAALLAGAMTVGGLLWFGGSRAKQVSLKEAQSRLPPGPVLGPVGNRPPPGVYQYQGSGADHLSLPPGSQRHGPSMPGTISLQGQNCWSFRIDFSSHHWQTWDFCRQGSALVQTGGRLWQLWPIGPVSLTNSTSISCHPDTTVVPSQPTPGRTWTSHCSATSSAVKGRMDATAVHRYLGRTTITVAGRQLQADHVTLTQTDQGSQTGTESYQMWFRVGSGLPLRLDQDITVRTATPLGTSTYTQRGTLTLVSTVAHRG